MEKFTYAQWNEKKVFEKLKAYKKDVLNKLKQDNADIDYIPTVKRSSMLGYYTTTVLFHYLRSQYGEPLW